MEAPLPTPYDIVDLPPFPWEPDGRAWLLLILLLCLLFLLVRLFSRHAPRRFTRSAREGIEGYLRELGALTRVVTKAECARTSYDIRRYLEASLGIPLRGGYLEGVRDEISPARRATLEGIEARLRRLDDARYAPDESHLPPSSIFVELLALLHDISPPPSAKEES